MPARYCGWKLLWAILCLAMGSMIFYQKIRSNGKTMPSASYPHEKAVDYLSNLKPIILNPLAKNFTRNVTPTAKISKKSPAAAAFIRAGMFFEAYQRMQPCTYTQNLRGDTVKSKDETNDYCDPMLANESGYDADAIATLKSAVEQGDVRAYLPYASLYALIIGEAHHEQNKSPLTTTQKSQLLSKEEDDYEELQKIFLSAAQDGHIEGYRALAMLAGEQPGGGVDQYTLLKEIPASLRTPEVNDEIASLDLLYPNTGESTPK